MYVPLSFDSKSCFKTQDIIDKSGEDVCPIMVDVNYISSKEDETRIF